MILDTKKIIGNRYTYASVFVFAEIISIKALIANRSLAVRAGDRGHRETTRNGRARCAGLSIAVVCTRAGVSGSVLRHGTSIVMRSVRAYLTGLGIMRTFTGTERAYAEVT